MTRRDPGPFRKTPLYAGRVTGEAISAVLMTLIPMGAGLPLLWLYPSGGLGPWLLPFSLFLPVLMFLALYPGRAMRPQLFQEGFVPAGATGFSVLAWTWRDFRSKVWWPEVESVWVWKWKGRKVVDRVEFQIAGHAPFRFNVALPDDPEEAELSLMLLERWELLGGQAGEGER